MIAFLDGRFVAEEQALISIFDRSFLYGDGLFETMLVRGGQPLLWPQHMHRLQRGAECLHLTLPFTPNALLQHTSELIARNQMPDSILRLHLSRGVGGRGYSLRNTRMPKVILTLHPAPPKQTSPAWKLVTSSLALPTGQRWTRHKTANKLPHILARAEAEAAGADEALLLNTEGTIAEGTCSNLFWIENQTVCTPSLAQGALDGITRALVLDTCSGRRISTQERSITAVDLARADGVFLTLSTWGIVEAVSLDGQPLQRSPLTQTLRGALRTSFEP